LVDRYSIVILNLIAMAERLSADDKMYMKMIGPDCENLILSYVEQLDTTEKYDRVVQQMKYVLDHGVPIRPAYFRADRYLYVLYEIRETELWPDDLHHGTGKLPLCVVYYHMTYVVHPGRIVTKTKFDWNEDFEVHLKVYKKNEYDFPNQLDWIKAHGYREGEGMELWLRSQWPAGIE
jgi:hypothetical protein